MWYYMQSKMDICVKNPYNKDPKVTFHMAIQTAMRWEIIIIIIFIECWLCTRQYSKCFVYVNSFTSHNNSLRISIIIISLL